MGQTRMIKAIWSCGVLFVAIAAHGAGSGDLERQALTRWVATHLHGAHLVPPFSFKLGGRPSSAVLQASRIKQTWQKLDRNRTQINTIWTADKAGLEIRVEATEYRDVPSVDWTVHLKNTSATDSPILEDVQALDAVFEERSAAPFVLHHSLGDSNSGDSFRPLSETLEPDRKFVLAPVGGRSSDGNLPFFNLQGVDGGTAIAVEWSGQWSTGFNQTSPTKAHVTAGMELTHLTLHPGEEIRTPKILIVFWHGQDPQRGNQFLRKTLLAHYSPRRNGQIVFAPLCGTVLEADPDGTYERAHVRVMKPHAERGLEVFWSDMDPQQWYPGGFPSGTGNWQVDTAKYPRGLKPVGDAARSAGLGYLLWFEPERVAPGTEIARDHPEWVLGGSNGGLFWLGNPKARQWITQRVEEQIKSAGLSWVRWDFNIQPLGYWRGADAPDRQGISEIRHIEGLYAFWDELERKYPGLLIDVCASGGRRLDIETLSRGLPLWHSDLQCDGPHFEADQLQNAGLYQWLPLHACGLFALEPSYAFRSAFTTGNVFALAADSPANEQGVRKSVELQKRLRPFVLGDFYETLPHSADIGAWFAYQFHRTDLDSGYLIAFRRAKCEETTKVVSIHWIVPSHRYDVEFVDTGIHKKLTGKELAHIAVSVTTAPGSEIVIYRRAP